jgi:hypothetical protein
VYGHVADQLTTLRMNAARVTLAKYRSIGKDLAMLQGGYQRFRVAASAAQSRYGADIHYKEGFDNLNAEIGMMYRHAGLDMADSTPAEPVQGDVGEMENAAIAASEASIHASVRAVKAKLHAGDAELREEVEKMIAAAQETRAHLETIDPSRIKSTKKLATLIHEMEAVVVDVEKNPKLHEFLQQVAFRNTLSVLHSHLKK